MSDVPAATSIPPSLLEYDQWVCWRAQDRDGKSTKVPINPETSRYASTTDPTTWGSFETARETALAGSADGVGFVFTDDDPYVGVDLDDCRVPETGSLTDAATDIVEQLDSYTEVSPSGTGVHVLVEGTLPNGRNRHDWVECYETARFFTVTGEHCSGTPMRIEARVSALDDVHDAYLRADADSEWTDESEDDGSGQDVSATSAIDIAAESESTGDVELSDAELLDRARNAANGEKFDRLWQGDTSGYDSHSEADMALCSLLAFWTGCDHTRIDSLFRDSGLMREKWDERHFADGSTYGEKTIERAVASTDEVYEPGGSDSSGPRIDATTEGDVAADHDIAGAAAVAASGGGERRDRSELLEVIGELQGQVERLERENQELRRELSHAEAGTDADDTSGTTSGLLQRLFPG